MTSIREKIKNKIDEKFVHDNVVKVNDKDVDVVLENSEEIENKMANTNSFNKYIEIGKIMMGMVRDYKAGNYTKIPWFIIATIIVGLLYVLNPIDIIPDFIPGLGYIDDLAVFSIVMGWIETDVHTYLDWKLDENKKVLEK